ncbi:flagellin [Chitinivibrio alkaliphilus]|uniref:Flagellin n=1 Tax=Chitinivibrio alkaliphilus ACht1 TaxID=1313304 RepID=U7DCT3_9BACT|nr:flagellin [Chitinivibrio alkaliphilus]ERP39373.1 flagellin [Chitinivibrio alkaliphilus ACht1]
MPRINHNIPAMVAANTLMRTERQLSKSIERLSTGQKINFAYDDAAGYSVSEQMRMETKNLQMGSQNIENGRSLLDIVDGGLKEIQDIVNRLRELAVNSANGTLTPDDREYIQKETDQLLEEIDRISNSTEFNGNALINGDAPWGEGRGGKLHIGSGFDSNTDIFYIRLHDMQVHEDGLDIADIDLSNPDTAQEAIGRLDQASSTITGELANVGAFGNRLNHAARNQASMTQNIIAADSIIRDTDMAEETAKRSQLTVLHNAGVSVLAQANSFPQDILQLLQF